MSTRPQRFQCDRGDIAISQSEIYKQGEINSALLESTANNISSLRAGLAQEISNHSTLSITWKKAVNLFNVKRKDKQYSALRSDDPDEYHVALIAYSMETGFYSELNKACRELTSASAARKFRFRYYWKILTLAIVNVYGYPESLDSNDRLYRGCTFVFPGLRVGNSFMLSHFVSTSVDEGVAYAFGPYKAPNKPSSILIIENIMQSGMLAHQGAGGDGTAAINNIRMNHHSEYPGENEVLLWSMEGFKVVNIKQEGLITKVYLRA